MKLDRLLNLPKVMVGSAQATKPDTLTLAIVYLASYGQSLFVEIDSLLDLRNVSSIVRQL